MRGCHSECQAERSEGDRHGSGGRRSPYNMAKTYINKEETAVLGNKEWLLNPVLSNHWNNGNTLSLPERRHFENAMELEPGNGYQVPTIKELEMLYKQIKLLDIEDMFTDRMSSYWSRSATGHSQEAYAFSFYTGERRKVPMYSRHSLLLVRSTDAHTREDSNSR